MTGLLTADIHLTPAARDAHRWDLFPWLRKQAKKTGAKFVVLNGDLTDAKDRHQAELVNRLAAEIEQLAQVTEVFINRGNHDYIDINTPFFKFLGLRDSRVHFITEPTYVELDDGVNGARTSKMSLFLPNTRNYEEDWANVNFEKVRYVFCHQTFDGCVVENGTRLSGISASYFAKFPKLKVWSGDIHVPQRLGPNGQVEYIGSPYRIRFGDSFEPRVVLLRNGKSEDLHFPTVEKHLVVLKRIERLKTYKFPEGAQVKVRLELHRGDYPMWKEYKRAIVEYAQKQGWELYGPELKALADDTTPDEENMEAQVSYRKPIAVLKDFARKKEIDADLTKVGVELLKAV